MKPYPVLRRILTALLLPAALWAQEDRLKNPILFVTQLPLPAEWMTVSQSFGNHLGNIANAGRGGDLYIRYPDATLKNLTAAAGYGNPGFQGDQSIAVRDPCVHWDGDKAVFSMVVGATQDQYQHLTFYWQLYEITGLGPDQTPTITRVPNQPDAYNNVSPVYGSDDRIIFASDRPHTGQPHLYPQLDEYESARTVTGLWSLDPDTGDLFLLNHTPSGAFDPFLDSAGRVVFTRWDHLQRDQQNNPELYDGQAFNWSDEGADAAPTGTNEEHFPEPLDAPAGHPANGHEFELFLPWEIDQDGRNEETLNHIGRHELQRYFNQSFRADDALEEFLGAGYNPNRIANLFQLREDPTRSGRFIGVNAPTFFHLTAGNLVALDAPPAQNPDSIRVDYLTGEVATAGHFRTPLPLQDGRMVAAHTDYTGLVDNLGTRTAPRSPFGFRLRLLTEEGGVLQPGPFLTQGLQKPVSFWDPDVLVTYPDDTELWELSPVEVAPRPRPPARRSRLAAPERQVFATAGVDPDDLRAYLRRHNLALVISRNVTARDRADRQQPFNLRVAGTATQTAPSDPVYDIAHLQFFQGDMVRGYSQTAGRRVLAQPMHAEGTLPTAAFNPPGSVPIAPDGSMAALVPARRAMTWQLTDPRGEPVVRERYWVSFQPGEIRTCSGCHGVNTADQVGRPEPQNPPQALKRLLAQLKGGPVATAVESGAAAQPEGPVLHDNYPNPFNGETTIAFTLPHAGRVSLKIFNALGQEVATLLNERRDSGRHQVRWHTGNRASGVYLYRLQVGDFVEEKKLTLSR